MKERRQPDEPAQTNTESSAQSPDAGTVLVIVTPDQRVGLVNRRCCEILECEVDEIVGRDWFDDFLPESVRSAAKHAFRRLLAGESDREYLESPVLTKTGESGVLAWRSSALHDAPGRIVAELSSGEAIADWKRSQQGMVSQAEIDETLADLLAEHTAELRAVNRNLEDEVAQRGRAERTLRDLSARLMMAQEQERSWLARELHDDLSQKLALLAVELEQLGQKPPSSPAEIRSRTLALWRRTQEISSDLHNLSRQLHPSQFRLLGLEPALKRFCRDFGEQQGLAVEFSFSPGRAAQAVPEDIALCLFRITQEALHNVAAHSGAQKAHVELSESQDAVRLCVSDPGVGFDKEASEGKPGLGLVSMRERAHLAGGEIAIESRPSQGTRITVTVPRSRSGPQNQPAPPQGKAGED